MTSDLGTPCLFSGCKERCPPTTEWRPQHPSLLSTGFAERFLLIRCVMMWANRRLKPSLVEPWFFRRMSLEVTRAGEERGKYCQARHVHVTPSSLDASEKGSRELLVRLTIVEGAPATTWKTDAKLSNKPDKGFLFIGCDVRN